MEETSTYQAEPKFTGEFFVPGQAPERIADDHFDRYRFAQRYATGARVLDIACGTGYGGPIFASAGASLNHGVDIGIEQVQWANQTHRKENVSYEVGDIRTFQSVELFDLIVCFETIEHIPFYKEALKNLYGLLSNTGTLLVSSPNRPITSPEAKSIRDKPLNEFHTQEFTPAELVNELREAGFSVDLKQIFGQRLRFPISSWKLLQLEKRIFGDPNEAYSSMPKRYRFRKPRYFLVEAKKFE